MDLADLPQDRAIRLISAAISELLPRPSDVAREPDVAELLDHMNEKFAPGIKDERERDARVLDALSEELDRRILANTDSDYIRARLGETGSLAPSQFEFSVTDDLAALFRRYGIHRADLAKAVGEPDAVQHLQPARLVSQDGGPLVSLFFRRERDRSTRKDPYLLFVSCIRTGATLQASGAYRIFASDVTPPAENTPLGWLRAFLDRFSLEFSFDDGAARRFSEYELIVTLGRSDRGVLRLHNPRDLSYEIHTLRRETDLGTVEFALTYVIDLTAYRAALRRHGVAVRE